MISRTSEVAVIASRTEPAVEAGRKYHFRIVRRGNSIEWFIDDLAIPFLSYTDPAPLAGRGYEYVGFRNWDNETWFDNLSITQLPPASP